MRWLAAVFMFAVPLSLACTAPLVFGTFDYEGATSSSVLDPFLENELMSREGVQLEYNPYHGDSYSAVARSCYANQCTLQINITVYYMSIYNKVMEIEAIAEYSSGAWSIMNYTILSEENVKR